ncbi:MAG: UDP-N-acetylmuramoyl-tripeptide--D-alanyl-D-alanine ligase [Patescibacteria group bacterium]|nr:UDP-N-acetylmuramoyl-tripeptide--D-alanyl-D-alanine ligase [Patescibacteria group bacterium]
MNKKQLRARLEKIIRKLAVLTLKKYQPGVIAITGSVGKTSAKEAIFSILNNSRSVRANYGNFNNELGLPLTILGDYDKISGKLFWIKVIFRSIMGLVFRLQYPEILILEYAADKPGDIKNLLDVARPQIGVVTGVGDIPAHVEFYSGPEAVAREKSKILEVLPNTGFAVLNFDDKYVAEMKNRTKAHIMGYGFGPDASIQITNFENRIENGRPEGISFKLNYSGSFVPVKIDGCLGKPQAYAAAAAAAVGFAFGMNLVKISDALRSYKPPLQRTTIIPGIKGSFVIDDAYNASPMSMKSAIELVSSIKLSARGGSALSGKRKVAVLGDMLEIGKYTIAAHEEIGRLASEVFDILITVGPRSKFIADAAYKKGMEAKNILSFESANDARMRVREIIKKGDIILVKGSHAMQLEKVVEEIKVV